MAYKDLREWIDKLEQEGELKRIKAKVDWNGEIGAITRRIYDRKGSALLFENIKDYTDGRCRRLFTGGLATQGRVAMMLGLPKNAGPAKMIELARQRFKERVEPITVDSGPVKENIIKESAINLYDFPVPKWHHKDGGRFINTFTGVVTKDPETGIFNLGMYRGTIKAENRITVPIVPTKGWGIHYAKYGKMGKPMPVAVVIGWEPVKGFMASAGISQNINEYDVMGAIRGEPVPLIKCETSDLMVPAWAEIVLEGFISPDRKTWEVDVTGGDYTGHYALQHRPTPVIRVECITHRNDPIFRGTLEGIGPGHPNEDSAMCQISHSANVWNALEKAEVPGILDVYLLPSSCWTTIAVQIHKIHRGHAKQVAMAIWGAGSITQEVGKFVIVVEEGIDIHNLEALEWAIAYHVNPAYDDVIIVPGLHGSAIDPSVPLKERNFIKFGAGKWARMLLDATKNWDYERREEYGGGVYPDVAFNLSPEEIELIERRWKEYRLE